MYNTILFTTSGALNLIIYTCRNVLHGGMVADTGTHVPFKLLVICTVFITLFHEICD